MTEQELRKYALEQAILIKRTDPTEKSDILNIAQRIYNWISDE